jgi:hypothetical protein
MMGVGDGLNWLRAQTAAAMVGAIKCREYLHQTSTLILRFPRLHTSRGGPKSANRSLEPFN